MSWSFRHIIHQIIQNQIFFISIVVALVALSRNVLVKVFRFESISTITNASIPFYYWLIFCYEFITYCREPSFSYICYFLLSITFEECQLRHSWNVNEQVVWYENKISQADLCRSLSLSFANANQIYKFPLKYFLFVSFITCPALEKHIRRKSLSGNVALYDLCVHSRWAPPVIPKPDATYMMSAKTKGQELDCMI